MAGFLEGFSNGQAERWQADQGAFQPKEPMDESRTFRQHQLEALAGGSRNRRLDQALLLLHSSILTTSARSSARQFEILACWTARCWEEPKGGVQPLHVVLVW